MLRNSPEYNIERIVAKGNPFAVYIFPGEETVYYETGNQCGREGEGRFVYDGWLCRWKDRHHIGDVQESPTANYNDPEPIDFKTYASNLEDIIRGLKKDGGKVVISRRIAGKDKLNPRHIADLATRYFKTKPNTFRALFTDTHGAIWLVATPELLIDIDLRTNELHTMALAGTAAPDGFSEQKGPEWEKNLNEHTIVSDYIAEVLENKNFDVHKGELSILPGGEYCHMCTGITARYTGENPLDYGRLIDALNPTPAVAGYPLEKALRTISKAETHSRDLYSGIVGVESRDRLRLYVNLRCARFDSSGWSLFAGGGIVSESDPAREWQETIMKTSALQKLLGK